MSDVASLIDDLQATIASGTAEQRSRMLERVAALFVAGSRRFSDAQVEVFDDVLIRIAEEIELTARARLSERLAPIPNAPRKVIRSLAFDDAIEVAGPVLRQSRQLNDNDLVASARTKSQEHLHAIAQRPTLSEAVTDVLVHRGDRRTVRTVVRNTGARFSEAGFDKLTTRTRGDDALTLCLGLRTDIPRHHFLHILEGASAAARAKLEAANPQASAAIQGTVAEIATTLSSAVRDASEEHAKAKAAAKRRFVTRQLGEVDVHASAHVHNFEKTVVALAFLGRYPIEVVERALLDDGVEMILVLLKAAGCARSTARTVLLMKAANRRLSPEDLERALSSYDRMYKSTAKRILSFHSKRLKELAKDAKRPAEPAEPAEMVAI